MPRIADPQVGRALSRTPADVVLEELARRRLSRQQLAVRARISLSTLGRGAHLIPVSTPIALVPLKGLSQVHFGRIHSAHQAHAQYRALLKRTVEEPFALLLSI